MGLESPCLSVVCLLLHVLEGKTCRQGQAAVGCSAWMGTAPFEQAGFPPPAWRVPAQVVRRRSAGRDTPEGSTPEPCNRPLGQHIDFTASGAFLAGQAPLVEGRPAPRRAPTLGRLARRRIKQAAPCRLPPLDLTSPDDPIDVPASRRCAAAGSKLRARVVGLVVAAGWPWRPTALLWWRCTASRAASGRRGPR